MNSKAPDLRPHIIDFPSFGDTQTGIITVAENFNHVPFAVQRVFWTYYIPNHVERGGHAHYELYQLLMAVNGVIEIKTESREGEQDSFLLDSPNKGLLMPPPFWHTMRFAHNAVLLSLASLPYDEKDYIRDYSVFKQGL